MALERRLSDAEVTAVLRRAAEDSSAQGLTVAQVEEIARDVGLPSDAVQRALIESANGVLRPADVRRTLGVPTAVKKDVVLPGEMSDASWDVLVSMLRATFNAHGVVTRTGVVREWRNGRLRVALEPMGSGHRLRMSTQKDGALQGPMIGATAALAYGATLATTATARPGMMMLAAIPVLLGGALGVLPFFTLPRWARTRSEQFEAVAREAAALVADPTQPADRPTLRA